MEKSVQPASALPRRPLILLGITVFLLHVLVTGGHLMSPDEELMYRMTESLAFHGSTHVLPLEADLVTGALPPGFPARATFATRPGHEPGVFHAQYLPLQPLIAAPILWLARALEGALATPFAAVMWPGMTITYLRPLPADEFAVAVFRRGFLVILFNPLVSALSAMALARLATLLTGSRRAAVAAAACWAFGTMAWPHARTFFTEPLAGLFAFLALDQICRWFLAPSDRPALRNAVLAGVFLGLANLTRVDSPFFTAGLIVAMVGLAAWKYLRAESWARRPGRNPVSDVLLAGGIATIAWLLLQAANTARFGFDVTSGYGDQAESVRFTTPILVGLHGLLMSPGKGVLFFSPALLIGFWGWCAVPSAQRWLVALAFIGYFPFFIAMAAWQNWDGGWCWGPRHIVQIHLPIMLGAAFLFRQHAHAFRRLFVALIMTVGVAVQIYGSSQSPLEYYREYFMTFRDLEYHRVNIRDLQAMSIQRDFAFLLRQRDGAIGAERLPGDFPAPMIDSIYLPQHTQWASYHRMWQFGFCDLFFLNALTGRNMPDRWSEEP